ncbi:MAG: family 78 glycoside hydrolase catalytic domain, partial [Planctomycetota bacterium]
MKERLRFCSPAVLSLSLVFACSGCQLWRVLHPTGQPITVVRLRCEYLADPMGIETMSPRLSWVLESRERAQRQSGYQILVASELSKLSTERADLWNTGKVNSTRSVHVEYEGKRPVSGQRCFWKVRVWDRNDQPSGWSDVGTWSMGLIEASDWKAKWISFKDDSELEASQQKMVLPPARYYRKEFEARSQVRRATAYATALGIYELHINGRRVSEQMFTPGWSDYRKRLYYNTFDVSELLAAGGNTIAAIVADGWYSGYVGYGLLVGYGPNKCGRYIYGKTPALLVQLEIEYADGRTERLVTDTTWKVGTGPLVGADMLMGETYDARLEIPGWDRCGFDDGSWAKAILAEDNGSTKAIFHDKAGSEEVELGFAAPPVMQSYQAPPIRPTEMIRPVAISEPDDGAYIFDMGQNFSGVVRLSVKGARGQRIKIRHGEMLHPDGRLMTENLRKARATDFYVLKGDPVGETYEPRFTYHGFQFVELTGLAEMPTLDTVTGIVIHSDTPMVSAFSCSDEMVNQLFSNVTWTQRANFFEVPTDCPQRDERLGWTGDAQIYVRTATYNADVGAFFTKWLDDLAEAQLANGAFPDYAPYPMMHGKPNRGFATAWADAGIICPYTIYKVYGDRRVIERHYDAMSRFMAFRRKQSPDFLGVATGNGWGDWLSLGSKTPVAFIDTVYFA